MNGQCSRHASTAATVVFSEPDTSMTTTMVRGRVCLRGLSSVLPLLCIVPGIPSYRCDHVTARTSDPVPFVSTPIYVQATARRLPLLVALSRCRRHAGAGERRPAVPPGLLHPLPLACMYADTADWATSTAESFIRETELIQARLLEWPNGELVPAVQKRCSKSVYMQPSSTSMSSSLIWGDWGATRKTLD